MFKVKYMGKEKVFNQKVSLLSLLDEKDKYNYLAAKVNNRLRELTYEVYYDCEVEFLGFDNYNAIKIYETSLRYLIAMTFEILYPHLEIRFSYNVSRSLFLQILNGKKTIDNELLTQVNNKMKELIERDIPFKRKVVTNQEALEIYKARGFEDKIDALAYRPEKTVHFYECDGYLNYMYGYMVPSTGYLRQYVLRLLLPGIIIQYPRSELNGQIGPFEYASRYGHTLKQAYLWAKLCDAETVAKVNYQCETNVVDFMNLCETRHNNMLAELGELIKKDADTIRLIAIAGPSSSGKTTFAHRLRIQLMSKGIKPVKISIDDYYLGKEQCPRDENGEIDLEHINAIDVNLFNQQLLALIQGEEVELPRFDFQLQKRVRGNKIKVDANSPIIIEGIHALNEELTSLIPKHQKFKIYISPQIQINLDNHNPISLTDIRLIRRLVRDYKYRNSPAENTFSMWDSVRRGEFKWIYPHQEGADYVFNSELTYELCVLKKYAMPLLRAVKNESEHYITANRLIKYLKYFKDIEDDLVPCNSILREFIGGSCFKDV